MSSKKSRTKYPGLSISRLMSSRPAMVLAPNQREGVNDGCDSHRDDQPICEQVDEVGERRVTLPERGGHHPSSRSTMRIVSPGNTETLSDLSQRQSSSV